MKLGVPVSVVESVGEFLKSESIPLDAVDGDDCAVRVVKTEERLESNLETLYCGGWIACETARAMAESLRISIPEMGKLLNHLDVKVRQCGLGLF